MICGKTPEEQNYRLCQAYYTHHALGPSFSARTESCLHVKSLFRLTALLHVMYKPRDAKVRQGQTLIKELTILLPLKLIKFGAIFPLETIDNHSRSYQIS